MQSRPLLEIENLTKSFGRGRRRQSETFAVHDVSFSIAAGETLAVVGESGSGKSTLARMLLRLIDPTSGRISIDGADIALLSGKQLAEFRRKIQMIFQDPYASLHPTRTTFDIISEGWRIHDGVEKKPQWRKRVAELLDQVGLPQHYADMYPVRLSGGERQRVAIARALAMRPEILVLDEPTSALDVSIQAQVVKLLMSLQEEAGLTYVFISHDLPLVHLVADRVAVMRRGELVEIGPADDIYEAPRTDYTKALLAASPALRVKEIETERAARGIADRHEYGDESD